MMVELKQRFLIHKFIQFNPVLTEQETVTVITENMRQKKIHRQVTEKLQLNCSIATIKS